MAKHGHLLKPVVERRFDLGHVAVGWDVTVAAAEDAASAEAPPDYAFSTLGPATPSHLLIAFSRGAEMDLQEDIAKLDELDELTLWFTAPAGEHADAAVGFTRSFRREFPGWRVYCVTFDGPLNMSRARDVVEQLSSHVDAELEIFIDQHGRVLVPSLVELPPPVTGVAFDPTRPWEIRRGRLHHFTPAPLSESEILVDVEALSLESGSARGFIGRRRADGVLVAGITQEAPASVVRTSASSVASIPDVLGEHYRTMPLLAMVACGLVFGRQLLRAPKDLLSIRIAIMPSDSVVGQGIVRILASVGVQPICIPTSETDYEVSMLHSASADLIFCGYDDSSMLSVARGCLSPTGSLFAWNDSQSGIPCVLERKPWLVSEALEATTPLLMNGLNTDGLSELASPRQLLDQMSPRAAFTLATESLFDGSRAYLLVGGIGSLGLYIALWMYQVTCATTHVW